MNTTAAEPNTQQVNPIGPRVAEENRAAAERDPALRAELARIAPFEEIAEKVIIGRTMKGCTQKELAQMTGTSYSQISRIESGQHLPDVVTLHKLGKALDIVFEIPLKQVDLTALRPRRKVSALSPSRGSVAPAAMSASASIRADRRR